MKAAKIVATNLVNLSVKVIEYGVYVSTIVFVIYSQLYDVGFREPTRVIYSTSCVNKQSGNEVPKELLPEELKKKMEETINTYSPYEDLLKSLPSEKT